MSILEKNNILIEVSKRTIKKVYLDSELPLVIGYSGGKDSTLTTQLIFEVLADMPIKSLKNHVYVISSDTLVENPPIIQKVITSMALIEEKAKELNLPISTHMVRPLASQSFWANIIGRGYPTPNQTFRWCTDRLKIEPANRFIKEVVSEHGEAIMVLGVREGESASRDRVLDSHTVEGKVLMKHSTLNNAFVFAPIIDFNIDEVWDYLLSNESPWGGNNKELYNLYADSNSNECPLVVDQDTKDNAGSCGNTRFGCWTCTVVNEDKSLTGSIESGEEWLRPLLKYRNWLSSIRDNRELRMKRRTGGAIYFSSIQFKDNELIIPKKSMRAKLTIKNINNKWIDNNGDKWKVFKTEKAATEHIKKQKIDLSSSYDPRIIAKKRDGNYGQLGLGPFTFTARKMMLRKLLETQKVVGKQFKIITEEELFEIRSIWLKNGDLEDSLPSIYRKSMKKSLKWKKDDISLVNNEDLNTLQKLCEEEGIDFNLFKRILNVGKDYHGNLIRRNSVSEISSLLKMEYLHVGENK